MEIILISPFAKYLSDFNDNRDMKTFNTKLIAPFIITLLLTGCMPDSLTKFKKDEPKKAVAVVEPTPVSTVVVDDTGVPLTFDEPAYFSFISPLNPVKIATLGTALDESAFLDGSLGDDVKFPKFFERCDLVTSGVNAQAVSLPPGVSLNISSCTFIGEPTSPKSVLISFCSDGVSLDQATCETNPMIWNAVTETCSLPDLAYANSISCGAAFHKWYPAGGPIPYSVKMTYHDASGLQKFIYSTFHLGVYKRLTAMDYTQADKIQLKVIGSGSFTNIIPLLTTTGTVGSYARANTITSNFDVAGVAKFVDPTLSLIGVNKLIPVKVTSTIPFIVNTFVTVEGNSAIVGRIFKIDSTNRIIYVENISEDNKSFAIANRICSNSLTGVCATSYEIMDISESYTYKKDQLIDNDKQYFSELFKIVTPSNVFEVGSLIKPIKPIASSEISTTNGISYTISPALPCNDPLNTADCISLSATTGVISGTFTSALANTSFTITATNPLGSVSTIISLSAITPPISLALTQNQIITVYDTSSFKIGETVIQPIAPPLTEAKKGKVLKIINKYQMAIEAFNGTFLPGESLDNNSSAYLVEKTVIIPYASCTDTSYITAATCVSPEIWAPTGAMNFNLVITTANSGSYLAGSYITSTAGTGAGAYGKVVYVAPGRVCSDPQYNTEAICLAASETWNLTGRDDLFVQYLTQTLSLTPTSTATAKTFHEGDTVSGTTIYRIQNSAMKISAQLNTDPGLLAADPNNFRLFNKGSDIVSNAKAAAYTNLITGSCSSVLYTNARSCYAGAEDWTYVLSLSEISQTSAGSSLKIGQIIYNHETEREALANSTITAVTHNNTFIFERGKSMLLTGNISAGNGIIYSIVPALPAGLSLNTANGTISGAATNASTKRDYLVTATNFIGSTTSVISIEVKDFFEIIEKTGASSALLHKVGDYQSNRKCRVDATDIASLNNGKSLDIRCFLDLEEEDAFSKNIKLNLFTGPGICQYVRYEPYYFNSWQPHQSSGVSSRYRTPAITRIGCSNLNNTGTAPIENMCEGNYSFYEPTYPNCDEGTLTSYTETYTQDTVSGICTLTQVTTNTLNCGGKKAHCLAGPAKDYFSLTNLNLGVRKTITSTVAGVDTTYDHASPISKGDSSSVNLRNVNGTINNQCFSSAADTLTWKNKTASLGTKTTPLGADSNPFYTFVCLDAAQDIKARIRIIVRDWNRTFNIESDVHNQNFKDLTALPVTLTPAASMNIDTLDLFNNSYNSISDWDDNYAGSGASTFTASTCGAQAAGTCTDIAGIFAENSHCIAAGGTVVPGGDGFCSDPTKTTYRSCVSAGTCSNPGDTDAGSCAENLGIWTAENWTAAVCTFSNQNQCQYYGGTWTGPEQYKFPSTLLGL